MAWYPTTKLCTSWQIVSIFVYFNYYHIIQQKLNFVNIFGTKFTYITNAQLSKKYVNIGIDIFCGGILWIIEKLIDWV